MDDGAYVSDGEHMSEERRRAGAVTFEELSAGLVWPHLLRGFGYACRPGVIAIGFLAALWVFLGGYGLAELWAALGDSRGPFGALGSFWPTGGPAAIEDRFGGALASEGFSESGVGLVALWSLPALGLAGVAIGRMVSLEFCASRRLSLIHAVRFAVGRWASVLVFALAMPALIAVLMLVLWILGLVFFTSEPMGVVGALGFVVALVLGFGAALASVLFLLSFLMMPAALAVESTDGMDAVQRSVSYVTSRTVRFFGYLLVIGAALFVAYAFVQELVRWTVGVSFGVTGAGDVPPGSTRADILLFWVQGVWLLFIGWLIGTLMSSGTMLYLVMRRVVDGHDVREVWLSDGVAGETPAEIAASSGGADDQPDA